MPMVRQTFSGVGRPRRHHPREPSGRVQRAPTQETQKEIMSVVLAQPHRNDSEDNRRHWALGRLVLDGRVKVPDMSEGKLIRAAELYAQAYADLRWVLDSRRPWSNSHARSPIDATLEDRQRVERAWGDVTEALRESGPMAVKSAEYVILDNPPDEAVLAWWVVHSLSGALAALVQHYGLEE